MIMCRVYGSIEGKEITLYLLTTFREILKIN